MTLLLIVKVSVLFSVALAVAVTARRATADTRHKAMAAAQLAALALPLLGLIVPPLAIQWVPERAPQAAAAGTNEPLYEVETGSTPVAPAHRPTPNVPALIWLAGFAAIAATRLAAFARAAAVVRRAQRFGDVLISDEIDQPSTLGRWILLPRHAQSWSPDRLRTVLLHEQAHIARHDTLLGLAGDAVCAVYWFHPLAWLLARRARLERERACDDRVLACGVTPGQYAAALLDVARSVAGRSAAAMPMAEPSQLEQRIRAILDPAVRRRSRRAAGMVVALAILAGTPVLAALTPARTVPRPRSIEPDLLGDAVASPFSERVQPPVAVRRVEASGPDAALISLMTDAAARQPQTQIDFVAERARWALSRVHNGQLVAPLLESLGDPDWRIRAYAAWALGYAGDGRATAPLAALLDQPVWRVRAMAAHALATIGDPAAEEAMLAVIGDPAWQVRSGVVRYLAAIGGHRTVLEAMRADRHMAVRSIAEQSLGGR